jgi:hypothetical protein
MDHDNIIKIILNNDGYIIGGYIREWLANGKPKDTGWKDIDIKCPVESEETIRKKINLLYPNIKLDFSPNSFNGYRNPYSCNLVKYDGNFKNVNCQIDMDFVSLTRDKRCLFLKKNNIGRVLSFEQRLLNDGWKIEFPFIKN